MRRVISLTIEFPSIESQNLRTAISNTLVSNLDLKILDIYDGEDVRPQETVESKLQGIGSYTDPTVVRILNN